MGEVSKSIEEGQPAKDVRAAAVGAATTAHSQAVDACIAANKALGEAQEAQKKADQELKAAIKSVRNFWPDVEKTADRLDLVTRKLKDLEESTLSYFAELKELAPPPPEPEPLPAVSAMEPAESATVA